MRTLWLVPMLAACTDPVRVVGTVMSAPGEGRGLLAGATVKIIDDEGVEFDRATSDRDGAFSVDAPRASTIYAVVEGDGLSPTSFTGVSGYNAKLVVADGDIFAVSTGLRTAWEFAYRGCPGIGDGAGLVVGQVRALEVVDAETGEHPPLSQAEIHTESQPPPGVPRVDAPGCYLDATGDRYDPAATVTNDDGWFAVPSVEPGLHTLVVELHVAPTAVQASFYEVWMPEGGVAARFPTYVETPF